MTWLITKLISLCLGFGHILVLARASTKVSYLLHKALCYNQGELIQYTYMAGELHKNFKKAVQNDEKDDIIKKKADELDEYLKSRFRRVCLKNFEMAMSIFTSMRGRSLLTPPRFGLKVHEYKSKEKRRYVRTLWGTPPYFEKNRCLVDENTASKCIHEDAFFFPTNNIPHDVLHNSYENPRLNSECVKEYMKLKNKVFRIFKAIPSLLRKTYIDYDWQKCWAKKPHAPIEKGKPLAKHLTCYKSTMVIPLTLTRNLMDGKFIKIVESKGRITGYFNPDELDVDKSGDHKYIYGYFCIDHPSTNYFYEDYDQFLGYFFADILCVFLYAMLTYTKLSYTYMNLRDPEVAEELKKQGLM